MTKNKEKNLRKRMNWYRDANCKKKERTNKRKSADLINEYIKKVDDMEPCRQSSINTIVVSQINEPHDRNKERQERVNLPFKRQLNTTHKPARCEPIIVHTPKSRFHFDLKRN